MNSKIERNKLAFHLCFPKNAPFCSEYSLLLCVCLCVAFCQIRVYCVEWQFFGDCMNSDPGSSLRSARNASVKIKKLFVKRQVTLSSTKVNVVRSRFSLWENAVELF